MASLSTFIVVYDGREFAPVQVVAEGLLLGRAPECDVQLNDQSLPLAIGGIKEVKGRFYFLRHEPSPFDEVEEQVKVNGRKVVGEEALASGDILAISRYRILLGREGNSLVLRVSVDPDLPLGPLDTSPAVAQDSMGAVEAAPTSEKGTESEKPEYLVREWLDRRVWRDQRKLVHQAFLEPAPPKRERGTEFNWIPTMDLLPPWPAAFLICCILLIAGAAAVAYSFRPAVFSPGALSHAHTTASLTLSPAIASKTIGDSCWSCHSPRRSISANCQLCHQAIGFHATVTKAHEAAGITCLDCHIEHRGASFSTKAFAFVSCTNCHNDNNRRTYNGRSVHTPHGGTFGYPVSNGSWIWKGLEIEALKLKPEVAATWKPEYDEQTWRKAQFHAIHLYRVKAANGITGIEDGALSCSSCHKAFGSNFDRETPRQTCANCHNGYTEESTRRSLVEADKPNCTSCHVQHYYDDYRWGDLLTESAQEKRKRAIDKNYTDAVTRTAIPR